MNILSLFNGLSGLHLACDKAGIQVENCYYSEIDKYANKVTEKNYPNDIQLGDVTKWQEWDLDWSSIDLLAGGSPCQGFSFAGKQAGTLASVNGEIEIVSTREKYLELKARKENLENIIFLSESYLFWEYVLILDHIKSHNPNLKFLLENVKMKKELLQMIDDAMGVKSVVINSALLSAQNRVRHYWCNWEVKQPDDKGVLLRDILEETNNELRHCERIKEGNDGHIANATDIKGMDCIKRVYGQDGKAPTLTTMGGGHREPKVLINESATKQDKSYTLTASYGGAVAWNLCERKQRTMVPVSESNSADPNVYNGVLYRKLTPVECERLQTVPDNWTEAIEEHSYSLYNHKETDKKEDLYLCDVKLMGVKGKQEQKSKVTYALCTTSDLLGMDLLIYQRLIPIKTQNVNIVIEKLGKKEVELEGCVVDITKTGLDMKTLYMQIKSNLNLGQEGTKNALMVKTSTGKLLRITSAESCQEMRLFTILIAIKLITQLRICMYVKDRANIHYCIDSLKESQGNLLSVVLSSLRMETTEQTVSKTQRYKMIGNGWTIDVISHILSFIK